MKVTYKIIIALMLTLSACVGLKPVHRLIDQKEEYIWTGSDSAKKHLLTVDNAEGIWFTGKIIINFQDTLYLKGFEKEAIIQQTLNNLKTTQSIIQAWDIFSFGRKAIRQTQLELTINATRFHNFLFNLF